MIAVQPSDETDRVLVGRAPEEPRAGSDLSTTCEDDHRYREMWHDIVETATLVGATLLMVLLVAVLGRL